MSRTRRPPRPRVARRRPAGVDDDLRRRERPLAHRVRDDVQPAHALEVLRHALVRARAELEREHRRREREQERRRPGRRTAGRRMIACASRAPPVRSRVAPLDDPARDQAHAVERRREPVEQHGQERQRADHRHERDDEAADPEAAHERQRHEEHQREPDPDRRAAEDDRAAGRLHRAHDRVLSLATPAAAELLAIPVDDEQRVVDRDPEPDQHHEVLEVGRQLHEVREDPDDPERRGDRGRREHERDEEGERPEDEDEDRSAIGIAMKSSPTLRSSAKTGSRSCSIAAWPLTKSSAPGDRPDASRMSSVWPFASAGSRFETIVAATTASETGCDARDAARRQLLGRARGGRAHLRQQRLRAAPARARDDGERPGRLLAEVVLEDPLRPRRVRSGRVKRFVSRSLSPPTPRADDEDHEPDGEHGPAVADHPPRPAFHGAIRLAAPARPRSPRRGLPPLRPPAATARPRTRRRGETRGAPRAAQHEPDRGDTAIGRTLLARVRSWYGGRWGEIDRLQARSRSSSPSSGRCRASRACGRGSGRRSTATAPTTRPSSRSWSSWPASTRRTSRSRPPAARSSSAASAGERAAGRHYELMEIEYGRFRRQIPLPGDIDIDAAGDLLAGLAHDRAPRRRAAEGSRSRSGRDQGTVAPLTQSSPSRTRSSRSSRSRRRSSSPTR